MKKIRNALWWLAGAEIPILEHLPGESNRFVGIGIAIALEGILAFISMSLALGYITSNSLIIYPVAFIWTLIIVNIARLIIANNQTSDQPRRTGFKPASVLKITGSILLQALIGITIAQPILIRLFEYRLLHLNSMRDLMELFWALRGLAATDGNINFVIYSITFLLVLINLVPFISSFQPSDSMYLRAIQHSNYNGFRLLAKRSENKLTGASTNVGLGEVIEDLEKIKNNQPDKTGELNEKINSVIEKLNEDEKNKNDFSSGFTAYFKVIVSSIDKQIEQSNGNASKLLGQGLLICFIGLGLYAGMIIFWFDRFQKHGYKDYYLISILSTSILFIFIEFLGAWFLKQFRASSLLSTHLFKLKTVVDKYYLSYNLMKEFNSDSDQKEFSLKLLDHLRDEIRIPGDMANITNRPFTNEAVDLIASLINTAKRSSSL